MDKKKMIIGAVVTIVAVAAIAIVIANSNSSSNSTNESGVNYNYEAELSSGGFTNSHDRFMTTAGNCLIVKYTIKAVNDDGVMHSSTQPYVFFEYGGKTYTAASDHFPYGWTQPSMANVGKGDTSSSSCVFMNLPTNIDPNDILIKMKSSRYSDLEYALDRSLSV